MQLDLLSSAVSERRRRRHVVRTSVEAGRAVNRDRRIEAVVCELADSTPITSAELTAAMFWLKVGERPTTDDLLFVRRGLSDALARGFVEHAGERTCAVSGRKCVTWRLRTR